MGRSGEGCSARLCPCFPRGPAAAGRPEARPATAPSALRQASALRRASRLRLVPVELGRRSRLSLDPCFCGSFPCLYPTRPTLLCYLIGCCVPRIVQISRKLLPGRFGVFLRLINVNLVFDANVILEAEGANGHVPSIIFNQRSHLCFGGSLLSFSKTRFCPAFFLPFRKVLFSFHGLFCCFFFICLCVYFCEPLEYWCSRKFCTGLPRYSLLIGSGGAPRAPDTTSTQRIFPRRERVASQDATDTAEFQLARQVPDGQTDEDRDRRSRQNAPRTESEAFQSRGVARRDCAGASSLLRGHVRAESALSL